MFLEQVKLGFHLGLPSLVKVPLNPLPALPGFHSLLFRREAVIIEQIVTDPKEIGERPEKLL